MVDVNPWSGNYTSTIVQNNTIMGGFATTADTGGAQKGDNNDTAILKSVLRLCNFISAHTHGCCVIVL
jgi:hypothetical protein